MNDQPIITSVASNRGGVVGSTLPQTLFISGSNFAQGTILVFEGPMPTQVIRPPSVQFQNSNSLIAAVNIPVPAQGTPSNPVGKVWAVCNGMASGEYDFSIGKSE